MKMLDIAEHVVIPDGKLLALLVENETVRLTIQEYDWEKVIVTFNGCLILYHTMYMHDLSHVSVNQEGEYYDKALGMYFEDHEIGTSQTRDYYLVSLYGVFHEDPILQVVANSVYIERIT